LIDRYSTRLLAVGVALLVALGAGAPGTADAKGTSDPAARRAEVKKQRAAAASKIDTLKASDAEVDRALKDLDAHVRSQSGAVAEAERAVAAADARAREARAAEAAKAAELRNAEDDLESYAVQAYMSPPAADMLDAWSSGAVNDVARRLAFLEVGAERSTDLTDRLRSAREDLQLHRRQVEAAAAAASQSRDAARSQLAELDQARSQQRRIADSVERRLEAALAEAAALESLDKKLAAEIAARQAALARQIPKRSGRSGGRTTGTGGVQLTYVRGIQVNTQIADELEAMLAAAEADGLVFGGGGYRDSSDQVALRREHCGTSDYDVYEKPASECEPPTARPGASMHERGLAIDFTVGGRVITSRSSPGYQWLKAHASRYGFYNLPSEPWHWSTNGN
jgi:hypothetical protein